MRGFVSATKQFFAQIWADAMLMALVFVPLAMGLAFRFGVPVLESFLCSHFDKEYIISPYYPIFDLLLSVMTPLMFTAAGAMVILDEADNGIGRALVTSPLGKSGYLASRIGIPSMLATVYCIIVTMIFKLSEISFGRIVLLAICSGLFGVAFSLIIPSLARNKVEGMAVSKLSGLVMLGLPAALLLPAPIKYVCCILPSFWMTELVMEGSILNIAPAILTALLFIAFFAGRFRKRIF